MASVRVKQLIKNYGAVRAVNQLDLEVEDGEYLDLTQVIMNSRGGAVAARRVHNSEVADSNSAG